MGSSVCHPGWSPRNTISKPNINFVPDFQRRFKYRSAVPEVAPGTVNEPGLTLAITPIWSAPIRALEGHPTGGIGRPRPELQDGLHGLPGDLWRHEGLPEGGPGVRGDHHVGRRRRGPWSGLELRSGSPATSGYGGVVGGVRRTGWYTPSTVSYCCVRF